MNQKLLVRSLLFILLFSVLLFVIFLLWEILIPFLFAYILHFALKPAVNFLEQRGIHHTGSVVVVFVVFFVILALFLRIFIPAVINEFLLVQDNLPFYREALLEKISWLETSLSGKYFHVFRNVTLLLSSTWIGLSCSTRPGATQY